MTANALVMYSTHAPTDDHLGRLAELGVRATVAASEQDAIEAAAETDIILGHRYLRQVLPYAPQLRWVQSTAGGTDRLPVDELRRRAVALTRLTVSSPVIARHAVTLAWALTRKLPTSVRQQDAGLWDPPTEWLPFPKRALILGLGSIGRAIAEILTRDGLHVTAAGRSPRDRPPPSVDVVLDPKTWRRELPQTDWLFLALPHTSETRHIVGAAELAALPPHAVVVNVGRGETLDTGALQEALRVGRLGGAGLDVVWPALNGSDAALWHTPRLVMTPYVAAHSAERSADIEVFCEAQAERFLAGAPLHNVVP